MNTQWLMGSTDVRIIRGDILSLDVDAIVNPANTHLAHAGGLAGMIVRKGGDIIQKESDSLSPIRTSDAVITSAGTLPCRFVIHTAGPVQGEGDEDAKIRRAFINVLSLATEKGLKSLAIPAISTGIFGYPTLSCARMMKQAFLDFLPKNPTSLTEVTVCLWEQDKYDIFITEFNA
jgi:O-acetyl-ADP-ribose deacetylase (regulator of RNase III)